MKGIYKIRSMGYCKSSTQILSNTFIPPPVQIDILTLFPNICEGALTESMMKRAQEKNLATIRTHNLRDWAKDKHHVTDEPPYGGGQGMVLKAEPIFEAVESLQSQIRKSRRRKLS